MAQKCLHLHLGGTLPGCLHAWHPLFIYPLQKGVVVTGQIQTVLCERAQLNILQFLP